MSIVVSCSCGKRLRARDELASKRAKCPGCGKMLVVPPKVIDSEEDIYDVIDPPTAPSAPKPAAQPIAPPRPAIAAAPVAARVAQAQKSSPLATPALVQESGQNLRQYLYWALILALIPLVWSTFHREEHAVRTRIVQTIKAHPEAAAKLESGEDEFFGALPTHRLEGALLAHNSSAHWFFAFLSGAAFFGFI